MAEQFSMKGKIIAITGASRGIGRGLAAWFAAQEAHVVALARDKAQLDSLAGEIRAKGGQCSVRVLDVRTVSTIQPAFDSIVAEPPSTSRSPTGMNGCR